ncbi:protein FAM13A isoform X1 [Hydra vulgaris]|uniref:protein FAM13A isoform X1 n=1 Tax=Hydra vulgaris TaxID=6087 RepID=UPI0032EA6912
MGSSSYVNHTKLQTSGSSPMLLTPQLVSPRSESISSKVKKILTASPKVIKDKVQVLQNKTFGVPLEYLNHRDQSDVPIIVTRLCEYLKLHGLKHEGLFRVNGNMKVVEKLKTAFDMYGDADIEEIGDIAAVASLLKLFLRELSEPVIPEELQPIFIKIQDQHGKDKKKAAFMLKEIIQRMPKGNALLLKYLCEFMLSIADGSAVNKMTPLALAIVFGPNIFRCGEGLEGLREQAYVNAVLLIILQEFNEIFQINNTMFPDSKEVGSPEKPIPYFEHMKVMKNHRQRHKTIYTSDALILDSGEKDSAEQGSYYRSRNVTPKITINTSDDKVLKNEVNNEDINLDNSSLSPLNKNLVTKMINTSVKEHLFGNNMSSTESDILDEHLTPLTLPHHDRLGDLDIDVDNSNEYGKVKKLKKNVSKTLSSPYKLTEKSLTDNDLMYIAERTNSPLEPLTTARAPPPQNRRKMSRSTSVGHKKQLQSSNLSAPSLDIYKLSFEEEAKTKDIKKKESRLFNQNFVPFHSSPIHVDDNRDLNFKDMIQQEHKYDTTNQDLKKKIASLKKIIKVFEDNFEEVEGRKPKISEKYEIQKYITELGKLKKQLNDEAFKLINPPNVSKHKDSDVKELSDKEDLSKEDTLIALFSKLDKKRKEVGRPHDIMLMTYDELKEEKLAVQKSLLQYENLHGRPETKEDKVLMRPLYDRYRKIKRRIASSSRIISPVKTIYGDFNQMNIDSGLQHENDNYFINNFNEEKRQASVHSKNEFILSPRQPSYQPYLDSNKEFFENGHYLNSNENSGCLGVNERVDPSGETLNVTKKFIDASPAIKKNHVSESILYDATLSELIEQQNETKRAKKQLGKLLKEFEDKFFIDQHRKVQKEDRIPKEREYREYKLIKAKLRLIDALVAKKSEYNRVI